MTSPRTLKEYLQKKTIQRKNDFVLSSEAKNIPAPLSSDKHKKIDSLIIQIQEYVRNIVGDGPLYNRFKLMIENLQKTFQRELSEFHKRSVYTKIKNDQKHLDEVRKANQKLNLYVKECEKQKQEAGLKLQNLVSHNKQKNKLQKNKEEMVIVDNLEDEVVQKVTKVEKINSIQTNQAKNNKNGLKQSPFNSKSGKKLQLKL